MRFLRFVPSFHFGFMCRGIFDFGADQSDPRYDCFTMKQSMTIARVIRTLGAKRVAHLRRVVVMIKWRCEGKQFTASSAGREVFNN